MKMSAVEFDQISLGRVEKQTEESCFEIVKILFEGVKIGLKVYDGINKRQNTTKIDNFKKFESMLV